MLQKNIGLISKKIIIFMATLAMIIYPLNELFGEDKILNWHIHQDAFEVGGAQCIAFGVIVFLLCLLRRQKAAWIIIGAGILFATMQGVILPFITAYLYFEGVCYIGYSINKKWCQMDDLILNFVSGLSIWGAFAILCSLLKHGTINDLRMMTIGLVVIAFIINKGKYKTMMHRLHSTLQEKGDDKINLLVMIFLATIVLILAAKTNIDQDFDSIWYMLRPEYMLVGENSFYDNLGYSAFVFYYPKLVELFFLPISGLGDYSFLILGNIMIYVLFIVTGYKLISALCPEAEEYLKFAFTAVLFTIPALTSIVTTAKGDAFGAFLVVSAMYFFVLFTKKKQFSYLVYCLIALFLCTGTKFTFFLWGGIVGVVISCYAVYYLVKAIKNKDYKWINIYDVIVGAAGAFFIAGVHYRTYRLTGYPTYHKLLMFWRKLGFEGNGFLKTGESASSDKAIGEVEGRLFDFFFDPGGLSHTLMSWPTNLVLIMTVLVVVLMIGRKIRLDKTAVMLCIISAVELVCALYYVQIQSKPDGNYYYLPFFIMCITLFYILYLQLEKGTLVDCSKFIAVILSMSLLSTTMLTFTTNWSWSLGITPFEGEIIGDNFSDYKLDEKLYKREGYYNIAKYVEKEYDEYRFLCSGDKCRIKVGVEPYLSAFSDKYANPDLNATYENFKAYVQYAKIYGFIVDPDDTTKFKTYVEMLAEEYGCADYMEDEDATLYIIWF